MAILRTKIDMAFIYANNFLHQQNIAQNIHIVFDKYLIRAIASYLADKLQQY